MKHPPIIQGRLSDGLYLAIEKKKYKNGMPTGDYSTPWIHLQDAVSRGTITPLEAIDALTLGYLPEHLKVRASMYQHLL